MRQASCNAALAGDPAFTLLAPFVTTPEPSAFQTYDALVWVLFAPGAAGSTASGTLQVDVPATGDSFTVPIEANVIPKPTFAASLVLDRSGSMDLPSGVASQTRLAILKSAAPLFVHLLDDDDGIGVVRFDTDAAPAPPADTVAIAGSQIAGAGRNDALQAISAHATEPPWSHGDRRRRRGGLDPARRGSQLRGARHGRLHRRPRDRGQVHRRRHPTS